MHNYLSSAEDIQDSTLHYDREWSDLPPAMYQALAWTFDEYKTSFFVQTHASVGERDFLKKCAAIRCYSTEWPVLFGPEEHDISKVLGASLHNHAYHETYWKNKLCFL